jgi:hypothetical protein
MSGVPEPGNPKTWLARDLHLRKLPKRRRARNSQAIPLGNPRFGIDVPPGLLPHGAKNPDDEPPRCVVCGAVLSTYRPHGETKCALHRKRKRRKEIRAYKHRRRAQALAKKRRPLPKRKKR